MNLRVKLWETEKDRHMGECEVLSEEQVTSKEDCLKGILEAKRLYELNDYACIEAYVREEEDFLLLHMSTDGYMLCEKCISQEEFMELTTIKTDELIEMIDL